MMLLFLVSNLLYMIVQVQYVYYIINTCTMMREGSKTGRRG